MSVCPTAHGAPELILAVNLNDPFYGAAALHFDNLFERYGTPVFALNLVKVRYWSMPGESLT